MPWATLFLAVIATFFAFAPGLRAPLHFDDIDAIERNSSIRSLRTAWSPPRQIALSGRPVVNVSFALNRAMSAPAGVGDGAISPGEVMGIRLVNLAIHIACALLVYALVRLTAREQRYSELIAAHSEGFAVFVAALWMIHPLQTEVVHYATQRTESLMALFFLGTMYASARAWDALAPRRRIGWYVLGVVSALLGMGSKEVMVVAPVMVVLYDRAFRYHAWREAIASPARRLPYYAALCITTTWAVVLAVDSPRSSSVGFSLGISSLDYLRSQGWAIWHYLRLTIWPVGLSIDYGPARAVSNFSLLGLAGLAVGFIATIAAWRRANRFGWLAFLASWFFLILAPSSSIVPITTEIAAERRMYVPLAALLTLAGVAAVVGVSRWPRSRAFAAAAGAASFVALGVVTMNRSVVFTDLEALWRQAVRNAPQNPRAPENLATVIQQRDARRAGEVEALLHESLARDSAYGPAWYKLGVLALNDDRVDAARASLLRAQAINPRHPGVLAELGTVHLRRGDTAAAAGLLERSAELAPNDTVLVQIAQLHAAAGRSDESLHAYRRVFAVNPDRADVARFVAASLLESERSAEAIPVLEQLARSSRGGAVDAAMLAVAYAGTGQAARASAAAATAVRSGGNDARVFLLAGRALLEIGDPRAAEPVLTRAAELSTEPAEALTVLAAAKISLGNRDEAKALLRRALAVDPRYAPARASLARLR